MPESPIFEQVDGSGLYRLAGTCRQGRFIPATGHRQMRSMAEWLTPAPARTGRTVWQELCDAAVAWWERHRPTTFAVAPGAVWAGVPPVPDTLGEACKLRQAQRR